MHETTTMNLSEWLGKAVAQVQQWKDQWGLYTTHPALSIDEGSLQKAFETYTKRLEGNYPFFHPNYAGQMLKPPHPAAILGYLAAQIINPNNHALDGGPPTGQMEKEVIRDLAALFRLPEDTLGHLTSSGTIANLEALWIARELHPGKAVAFSEEAHYTHSRMCQVLGVETVTLPADAQGRMRLDALEEQLKTGRIGTVVVTTGTTALGAVDPVEEVVALCASYGCRVLADAAYGGFFALLAWADPATSPLDEAARRHFQALSRCDSVVVDPHKHGLQPYGCGCVLFRDPSVGRFYKHDSPYTYFTSDELHLGEISLECSRAGAAAGALWFTLKVLPLRSDEGLGPVLAACRHAALQWYGLLQSSEVLQPYHTPQLDIVTFFPRLSPCRASTLDALSQALFEQGMHASENPLFLSVLRAKSAALAPHIAHFDNDQPHARILRSVLMKPEHETYVEQIHHRAEALMREINIHA